MKRTFWIILGLIILGLGTYFLLVRQSTFTDTTNPTELNQITPEAQTTVQPSQITPEASASSQILIQNFAFVPAKLNVKVGTTVTWINKDSASHDVTSDTSGQAFKSQSLAQRESYNFIFNTPGTFTYHCGVHPNMKAEVIVTP